MVIHQIYASRQSFGAQMISLSAIYLWSLYILIYFTSFYHP